MDALEQLRQCNTCGRQTSDVYRLKAVDKHTKLRIVIHQCAECYEDEIRRVTRDHTNELKGQ